MFTSFLVESSCLPFRFKVHCKAGYRNGPLVYYISTRCASNRYSNHLIGSVPPGKPRCAVRRPGPGHPHSTIVRVAPDDDLGPVQPEGSLQGVNDRRLL
jgi:hypothetical protein